MATGARVAISDVEVGDWVVATDPVSGVTGPREVTATWPHEDTLVDLVASSGSVSTTEDHHFWNVTDQAWQESQHLDAGDQLLSADGTVVTVEGLDWATSHYSTAYDLTIDDLHTFYVRAGDADVLVHNTGCVPRLHWPSLTPEEGDALRNTIEQIRRGNHVGLNRHKFLNNEGQLPEGIEYFAYDVASDAADRGRRRVVVGGDNSIYYTQTHYGDAGSSHDFFIVSGP